MEKIILKNLDDLTGYIKKLLLQLERREYALIFLLYGDLGAGKTALVKGFARELGLTEEITSPTFVIQKEYPLDKHLFFKKLIHIDAYRLEDARELEYLGWNELIQNPENIIFLEWPSQVPGISLPCFYYKISLSIIDKETRELIEQKESL
jgi:tRNA threonylcarbamoyl adenosine modification protein YjeE